jgi:hypothetical protein
MATVIRPFTLEFLGFSDGQTRFAGCRDRRLTWRGKGN